MTLAPYFGGVNRDARSAFAGVGAFNLVRAEVYRAIGGHERLRLEIVDDVKLGMLLRRGGHRSRVFLGGKAVECAWASDVRGMIRALEKNAFANLNFSLGWLILATTLLGGALLASLIGPGTGTWAGLFAAAGWYSLVLPALVIARRERWPLVSVLLVPLTPPVLLAAMWNSAWVTLRQGGVRWRDTFYPLSALRAGLLRW